jgi:hypothetical protein
LLSIGAGEVGKAQGGKSEKSPKRCLTGNEGLVTKAGAAGEGAPGRETNLLTAAEKLLQ